MAASQAKGGSPKATVRWVVLGGVSLGLLVLALVFRHSSQLVKVVDGAMQPTLRPGDVVLVARVDFSATPPRRGDIVLARSREGTLWFRRVVGLPGETISIKESDLLVNGETVAEPYVARGPSLAAGATPVGDMQVLLLPDYRAGEVDLAQLATELTPVSLGQLVGRATRIVYPLSRWRGLP